MLYVLLILFGILSSVAYLKYFTAPYIWIFFSWLTVSLLMARSSSRSSVKVICFNLCLILLLLGAFESYLYVKNYKVLSRKRSRGVGLYSFISHDILGYVPKKNTTRSATKYFDDDVVFDVVYSIDSNGLRISPTHKQKIKGSILFFGGSFTFGEGVNDTETLPYITGILLDGNYSVYNFGFQGYGTHQMLAAIEHGLVDSIVESKPLYAIYQAFYPPHVYRLKGMLSWDKHGPHYIIGKDGEITYNGSFDDDRHPDAIFGWMIDKVNNQFKKSLLIQKITRRISVKDIDLFVEIVDRSKALLQISYPGIEFHVLMWASESKNPTVLEKLSKKGIKVHLIGNIFTSYKERTGQKGPYAIPYDGHPTPLAYRVFAEYVAHEIIGE